MFDNSIEAAIKAVEEREQGCPSDPQLAQIWRDTRDGRTWHPDPMIAAAIHEVETGRRYCADPILAAALEATRDMPEGGEPEPEPEYRPAVERPEFGGGDPYGDLQALYNAHERDSWVAAGTYKRADSLRVREAENG